MASDTDLLEQVVAGLDNNNVLEDITRVPSMEEQAQQQLLLQYFTQYPNSLINISSISLNNQNFMRINLLRSYLSSTILKATNFTSLCEEAQLLNSKLMQHGLVQDVNETFKLPPNASIPAITPFGNLKPIDLDLNINVLPIKRFLAKTGTNIGNAQGDGYLEFQLRNLFKGGETLRFDVSKGTKTRSSYLLTYSMPISPWWLGNISAFKNTTQFGLPIKVASEGFRGTLTSSFLKSKSLNHEFLFEKVFRTTKVNSATAADTLLFQAGNDSVTNVGHTMVYDTRDSTNVATKGLFLKLSNILCFDHFTKSQFEISKTLSWFKDDFLTLTTTLKTGFINNLYYNSKPIHRNDKFQLGGSNDIRLFQVGGIGPRDLNDSTGGDAFLSYGASIFTKLPFRKLYDSNLRLHFFLNGGKLINKNNANLVTTVNNLLTTNSTSIGVGIAFRHPMARFEFNFGVPLTAHENDLTRKGFQYGIGLSFL